MGRPAGLVSVGSLRWVVSAVNAEVGMSVARRTTPLVLAMLLSVSALATTRPVAAQQPMPMAEATDPPCADSVPPTAQLRPFAVPGPDFRPGGEPVDPPVPTVVLRVRVAAVSAPDAELQYRLIVENTSPAKAHHVAVRNPLPPNVRFVRATPEPDEKPPELIWKLGTLEPNARKEIVLVVVPTGPGDVSNCARVQFEHGQCVTTRVGNAPSPTPSPGPTTPDGKAQLRVRVTGPTPSTVEVGPEITFRTDVTNVGNAVAKGVILTNKLPAGFDFSNSNPSVPGDKGGVVTWTVGDILPGQTRRVSCMVLPKVTGTFAVRAEAQDAAGRTGQASSSVTVGEPKISVVVTGPKVRLVNRPATYQITISNPGTMAATNVVVVSEVTEGMSLVSATGGGRLSEERRRFDKMLNRDVSYQEVRWALGTLPPGERRVLQMVLKTSNSGRLDHRVLVTADHLEQRADVQTEFEEATGLTSEVEGSVNVIEVGGKMTYRVRAINQGDAPAKNIGVTVVVPEQMMVLKDRLDATARVEGQRVTFAPLPALAKKTPAEFVVEVQAVKPGEARLRTEVTGDLLVSGPIKDEVITTVVAEMPPK
jgi:uncharacterized repeat protein (TIGR01451 family)